MSALAISGLAIAVGLAVMACAYVWHNAGLVQRVEHLTSEVFPHTLAQLQDQPELLRGLRGRFRMVGVGCGGPACYFGFVLTDDGRAFDVVQSADRGLVEQDARWLAEQLGLSYESALVGPSPSATTFKASERRAQGAPVRAPAQKSHMRTKKVHLHAGGLNT